MNDGVYMHQLDEPFCKGEPLSDDGDDFMAFANMDAGRCCQVLRARSPEKRSLRILGSEAAGSDNKGESCQKGITETE